MRRLPLFLVLALASCGSVATNTPKPVLVQQSTAPAPVDVYTFCDTLTPLAAAAPLPGGVWQCWTGDWDELDLMTDLGDLGEYQRQQFPGNPDWERFSAALLRAFPGGVRVYRADYPNGSTYLIHGNAGAWTGGFSAWIAK